MIVLVDEEGMGAGDGKRRFRQAPPIANTIGGKEYSPRAVKENKVVDRTRVDRPTSSMSGMNGRPSDGFTSDWHAQASSTNGRFRPHVPPSVTSEHGGTNASELSFQLR